MSSKPDVLEVPGAAAAARSVDLSVIVPVSERPGDLPALWAEYASAIDVPYEFIFVLEPHFRHLAEKLARAVGGTSAVRILVAGQTLGESALVKLALEHCAGRNVLLLPAYHRVRAEAIPGLLRQVEEEGADMAVARRWPRRDPWINRLQHRVLHALARPLSGGRIHDIACGMQVVRRDVLADVPLYGDLYRFLPLIVHREGFRVVELDAAQHPADGHARVYSPGTYLRRLIDLLGLFFLLRFTEKPLRFFGLTGSIVSLAGAAVLVVLFLQRIGGQGIADRPLLVLGVMLVVLGVQAIALGLIGAIIVHLGAGSRRPYRLARVATGAPEADRVAPAFEDAPAESGELAATDGAGRRSVRGARVRH